MARIELLSQHHTRACYVLLPKQPSSDLQKLQSAEKKLLSALEAAQKVAFLLSSGGSRQELERLCGAFMADAQDSQLTLLELADRHQAPLPLQNSDYAQRLALAAAQKQLEAAEAQLGSVGGGAAGSIAEAQRG